MKLPESGRHTGPTAREKAMVSLSWTRAMSLLKDLRPNFGCLITLTMDRRTISDSSTCVRSWAPRNTWIESKSNLRKRPDAIWLVLVLNLLLKHLHIYDVCFYLGTVLLEWSNNFKWTLFKWLSFEQMLFLPHSYFTSIHVEMKFQAYSSKFL